MNLSLKILIPATLLAMTACTTAQIQSAQHVFTNVEGGIADACKVVNEAAAAAAAFAAVPVVGGVLVFAQAACGTAEAVSALAANADANTIPWLQALPKQLNDAVAPLKAAVK